MIKNLSKKNSSLKILNLLTGRIAISKKVISVILFLFLLITVLFFSCANKSENQEQINSLKSIDYIKQIPGKDDSIPVKIAQKGKVLISYSDCFTCHKEDERSVGPAFKDIAKRYPANKAYIDYLAKKIITGGSRSWGYPVMTPHSELSMDDAKMMVTYILSIK
ncbi:c-type cytochrome [Niabella ginsengisoli]|uniref:C-type cytochrome n=1 Tax=Niabella ginsengisoli TaxID=522298 RepID=A0ABS9SQA8_9BACT|nr:c-type cytochrome [Niabella ginsengisoli]MCH5600583.1 c-type cytochrome [Niabella ginsengisoli]